MRTLLASTLLLVCATAASAACDIRTAKLEESIAGKSELRQAANEQTVRDLRTLRDAAIVLETYRYGAECERLLEIVQQMAANPQKTMEQSGDTDEDKAEEVIDARKPKATVPDAAPAKPR